MVTISSCQVDFDPSLYGDPFPVVYGCICPEDSIQYIRLNRSFTGETNAVEMLNNPDSNYFEDAVVKLSLYNPITDSLVFQKEISRTMIGAGDDNLNPASHPTWLYTIPTAELPLTLYNTHYINLKAVLTVYIPSSKITCYATTNVYEKPWPLYPTENLHIDVDLYGAAPFKITWFSRGSKYQECLVHFNFLEYKSGVGLKKTAILKYWIPFPMNDVPISEEYQVEHFFYPVTFWNRLNKAIPDDDEVEYRKFVDLDFEITGAGNEYYDYTDLEERNEDYGLDNFTSNIVNGRGVFFSKRKLKLEGHRLGNKTLDSLANGELTRHLRFVKY